MSGARWLQVGGRDGWAHDEGHATGTFQTFDRLALGDGPPRKVQLYLPIALSPSRWVGVEYGLTNRSGGGTLRGSALVEELWPVLPDPVRRPGLWIDWGLRDDSQENQAGIGRR